MESTELTEQNPPEVEQENLHEVETPQILENTNEAQTEAVVDGNLPNAEVSENEEVNEEILDIFGNRLPIKTEKPKVEDTLPDEIRELVELGKRVKNNEFVQNILNAEDEGETPETVIEKISRKEYSTADPERVFRDYLKLKMPNITDEQLDAAWYKKLGGEDELDPVEMLAIQSQAEELNKLNPKPKWSGRQQVDPEIIQKQQQAAIENVEKYITARKGFKIMADKGEGGFTLSDKHIEKGLKYAQAIFSGQLTNKEDGTVSHSVLDALTLAANATDIMNTLRQSWISEGKVEVLSNEANLTPPKNRTQNTAPNVAKGNIDQKATFRAAQEAILKGTVK